jgi:hypothetical protein
MQEVNLNFSYNLTTAKFELDALQQEMLNFYIRADPKFRMAFYQDYTSQFFQYIKDKARLKEPIYLSVTGGVRSGKSYSAISVCWILNYLHGRIIDIRYITANEVDYLESLKNMPEKDLANSCFVIDEKKQGVFGIGSYAKKMKLQDMQNIIAKFNISNITLCPTKIDDKSQYALKSFGRDFNGVNRFMLYNLQAGDGASHRPMGMVYIPPFNKLLPEKIGSKLEKDYIKKKDAWILRETRGEGDVLYQIKRKTAEVFAKDTKYLELTKKDEKLAYLSMALGSEWTKAEIGELLNLTSIIAKGLMPNSD